MLNKISAYNYLGFGSILLIYYSLAIYWDDSYEWIRMQSLIVCILLTLSLFFLNNSYYLVLGVSMFVFGLNLPLLELLGVYSLPRGNRILLGDGITDNIPYDILSSTYMVNSFLVFSLFFAAIVDKYFIKFSVKKSKVKTANIFNILFRIVWIAVMFYNIRIAYSAQSLGYVEVMHKHSVDIGIGFLAKSFDTLYQALGAIWLYTSISRRSFLWRSGVFLIPFFIQLAAGARGETVAIIITLLFIYHQFYNTLRLRKVVVFAILSFFLITAFGMLRFDTELKDLSQLGIANLLVIGLVSASSSIGVLSYTMIKMDAFTNSVPFFFGYIQGIFSFAPNYSVEGIESKSYLAQHLTFLLNERKLLHGSTIGTSFSAELYELFDGSLLLVAVFGFIIFLVVGYFVKNMYRNPIFFYFVFQMLQFVWLSPRGSIMKVFSKELVIGLVALKLIDVLCTSYFVRNER